MRSKSASIRGLEALYQHAVSAAEQDRTDEAIRRFRSLLRMTARRRSAPPTERVRSLRRTRWRRLKSHRALAAACRVNLATCYVEQGLLTKAVAELEAAVKLQPQNFEAACQLGHAYERTGEAAKAMQQFRAVLRREPECAEAHTGLSRCHSRGGRYARAIRECEMALEICPDCHSARAELAIALKRSGRVSEALRAAEGMADKLPSEPARVHELAELWLKAKQPSRAVRALESLLARGQRCEATIKALAEAYITLGEYAKALEACAKSRAAGTDRIPILDLAVMAYEQIGDIPNALVAITELVQVAPLDGYAHFRMGAILQRSGDFNNAMARYAMAAELAADDDDVRDEAEEAIETLDAIQLQQIVALASANVVFRAKLGRDIESTLREYSFRVTDAAIGMLGSLDMEDLVPPAGDVDRRMSH